MLVRRLLAATTVACAAVGVLVTSTAATAAGSKCVALVVDFSHVGGSVSSACVTVGTSASSSDVLAAGHHKVTFDPRYGNDFVCAIDDVPAGGCHATDDTHYWVYYHRAPGSTAWHVSQEGAGTYKPANASTDGWVYDDGESPAPAPRDVPYRSICTNPPKSPPSSPTPTRSSSAAPTTAASHAPATTAAAVGASARPRHSATALASPTTTPVPTATGVATVSAAPVATVTPPRHSTRLHRSPLLLIGVLLAAGGLGAAAAVRMRRSAG